VIFPFLSNKAIDGEAVLLRGEALGHRATEIPVDLDCIVYDHLCERDQLSIDDELDLPDEDGDEVLGKTLVREARILINGRLKRSGDVGRFRFTLAHEVGHWRLHRRCILAADEQGSLFGEARARDVITTLNRGVVGPNPPRHEVQANRFAATLLIDPKILSREFAVRFGPEGAGAILNPLRHLTLRDRGRRLAGHVVRSSPSLAAAFAVSLEAMAIALESRGYLADGPSLFQS